MGETSSSTGRGTRRGKVERVLDDYELASLGDELVEAWTADGDERRSVRELADWVNTRVLDAALTRETHGTVEGEAQNYYRLLTSDEVSTASRLDAEHRLESAGIDVEQLTSDFVSHQAVYSYLTRDRGASHEVTPTDPAERLEETLDSVNRLRNRLSAVTERSIKTLGDADILAIDDVRASVLVRIECTACGERYTVREFFDGRGCDCVHRE